MSRRAESSEERCVIHIYIFFSFLCVSSTRYDANIFSFCFGNSDGENVPESDLVVRPSRRAKTAALEKTRLDLNTLIDQEANVS